MQQAWIDAFIIVASLIILGAYASFVRAFMVRACTWMFGPGIASFIDTKLTFIGVIHHELAHALMAAITGAKIKSMQLFKFKGNTLGTVNIIPRGPIVFRILQLALSGTAPVTIGALSLYLIYYNFFYDISEYTWVHFVLLAVGLSISYHMSLSKQDIKVAWAGIILVYLVLVVLFILIPLNQTMYFNYIKLVIGIITLNLLLAGIIRFFSIVRLKH